MRAHLIRSLFLLCLFSLPVSARPLRIVTLAPSLTEILYAVGAGDQVVGVSDFCNYPPIVKRKPSIGGVDNLNFEALAMLAPDLVLCPEISRDLQLKLRKATGASIRLIRTDRLASVMVNIRTLGKLTGHAKQGEVLAVRLEKKIDAFALEKKKNRARPSVFYLLWNDPLMTAGGGSYIDDLIRFAGGRNVAGKIGAPYPMYSWETLMLEDPDVIIGPSNLAGALRDFAGKKGLKAARKHRIYALDADVLSRPGPRVAEALEKMVEIFGKR